MHAQKINKLVLALFILNATIWFLLALISLGNGSGLQDFPSYLQGIISTLMFSNTALLFLSAWGLKKGGSFFYFLALAVVILNIFLTFTDQVGTLDWVTLVIDLILFFLMVVFHESIPRKRVRID